MDNVDEVWPARSSNLILASSVFCHVMVYGSSAGMVMGPCGGLMRGSRPAVCAVTVAMARERPKTVEKYMFCAKSERQYSDMSNQKVEKFNREGRRGNRKSTKSEIQGEHSDL